MAMEDDEERCPGCEECMDRDELLTRLIAQSEANVQEYGWSCMGVFPDEDTGAPSFTYTIGLALKGLPDLLIFGVPSRVGHALMAGAVEWLLKNGEPYDGQVVEEVGNYPLYLRELPQNEEVDTTVRQAVNYYSWREKRNVRGAKVYQLVWPDVEGRFPWDDGCDRRIHLLQTGLVDWRERPPSKH